VSYISLTQAACVFGKVIGLSKISASIRQIGPGVVYLTLTTAVGKYVIAEHVTPMQPLFQKVSHTMFGKPTFFSRMVAHVLLRGFCEQFSRDVVIWNNKSYVHKPMIVKNDGPIMAFRRWYSKFYPPIESAATNEKDKITGKQDLSW
jgi:cholesterol 7-dehydrogenase